MHAYLKPGITIKEKVGFVKINKFTISIVSLKFLNKKLFKLVFIEIFNSKTF